MSPKATLTACVIGKGPKVFQPLAGVYDGSDQDERGQLESIMREHCRLPAREICKALLECAQEKDDQLKRIHEED